MDRMGKEQAVFEQLSNFKQLQKVELKTLNFFPNSELIQTKAVVDASRGVRGKVCLFSWERLGAGQQELIFSSKAVAEDLNMKFRSKFNHGFANRGCLHCAILSLQGKRYAIFLSKCLK